MEANEEPTAGSTQQSGSIAQTTGAATALDSVKSSKPRPAARPRDLRKILLRVAWMSILLGIGMQLVIALAQLRDVGEFQPLIADFAQKISWSFVVCMGLAVGTGVSQTNRPVMGLAGLISAPVGFYMARGAHNGTSELLGLEAAALSVAPAVLIPTVRGIEYMCLAFALGWIARQAWGGLLAHLAAGLVTGLAFGSILLVLSPQQVSTALAIVSWAVNEVMFPVGCSLILFVSDVLSKVIPGGSPATGR